MNTLLEQSEYLLSNTSLGFKRFYLMKSNGKVASLELRVQEERVKQHLDYNG